MARKSVNTVARDFATYAAETIRRELDNPRTLIAACDVYRLDRSPSAADKIIQTIFERTTVEVDPDGEIFFRLPKPKRKDR